MPRRLRFFHAWFAVGLLLVAADVYLSLSTSVSGSSVLPDKVSHFLVYFAIAGWFSSLFPQRKPAVFVGALALGGLLEILQGLGGVRFAEWLDMAANLAGAGTGCALVALLPFNAFECIESRVSEAAR